MNELFNQIDNNRKKLDNHSFCLSLKNPQSIFGFKFIPHMTFFVLGFRDMLEKIRIKQPKNKAEELINQHCDEDSDHWKWFLEDLNTLNMDINYWGGNVENLLSLIWSQQDYEVRNQVYKVMHCIETCQSPNEKLIIIECLEAAFASFADSLCVAIKSQNLYKQLKYFGELHYEKEADHNMGSWLGENNTKTPIPSQTMHDTRIDIMELVIEDIFAGFHSVFDAWESAMTSQSEPQLQTSPKLMAIA